MRRPERRVQPEFEKGIHMDSTSDRLKVLLSEVYDGAIDTSSITEETRLVEDIGMKSIAMLYMAMAIEGEFGVSLTNDDLPKMRTVGDIVELVETRA